MISPFDPLTFPCGVRMKNRFLLGPLTNTQSHADGTISEEEFNWLVLRAKGNFGMILTCASHVQANGQGFRGQLGIFDEHHKEGLSKLASSIQSHDSLALVQLYHGGMRADPTLIKGSPVAPSNVERKGARGMTLQEVHTLRDDFVKAAVRAQRCGFDGVQLHGAHGYLIAQFISEKFNQRTDAYGKSFANRSRLLFEIIEGIRSVCGDEFILGVRLSPEKFGMQLREVKMICQKIDNAGIVDWIDLSLWDSFKYPEEEEHKEKSFLQHFADLNFKNTVISVAGKIRTARDVQDILDSKIDAVSIGTGAILHHDFPMRIKRDSNFESVSLPVTAGHLEGEGVSENFIQYLSLRDGFVKTKNHT